MSIDHRPIEPSPKLLSEAATPEHRETTLPLVQCGFNAEIHHLEGLTKELRRGSEIIVRTERGLEVGVILTTVPETDCIDLRPAKYVRHYLPEDRLLWQQLRSLSEKSAAACQNFLESSGVPDVLIEVEPLLDGRTIYFHFLGTVSESTESHVEQLAEVYRQEIANSEFANKLETGCGPGCGTAAKSACGTSSGCASCSLSGGCSVRRPAKNKS